MSLSDRHGELEDGVLVHYNGNMRRAPPPASVTLADLTREANVTPRKVRFYVELGLLPGPVQKGSATRYAAECLPRLRAIRHLLKHERMRLDAIKKKLSLLSPEAIEALLPTPATPPTPASTPPAPVPDESSAPAPPRYPAERWSYISLLPGLELRVRSDASPILQRLAQEIWERYSEGARSVAE